MEKCKDCKHWQEPNVLLFDRYDEVDQGDAQYGECQEYAQTFLVRFQDEEGEWQRRGKMMTRDDFGCVQFEAGP